MFQDGHTLRAYREKIGLSQAKLAEVSGISQHLISAFELGKERLSPSLILRLHETIGDEQTEAVISRRKRYREHSYSTRRHDPARIRRHQRTESNASYLRELKYLEDRPEPAFSAVSLFSGCGGLSLGFRSAGYRITGFVEIDDDLSEIYQGNFPDSRRIGGSIQDLSNAEVSAFLEENGPVDVLLGGPPCQGFSLAGKRKIEDPRNELFRDYVRILDLLRPKVAVLENVRLLTSMKAKSGNLVKDEIAEEFRRHGYSVRLFEVNARDFGVPQHRERVIFLAVDSALGKTPSLPEPTFGRAPDLWSVAQPFRTFADACSDLTFIESGEACEEDPLHTAVSHPDHVIDWLWNVPEGRSAHENEDPENRPPSGYNTSYKRQVWDEPAGTVQTTFGMISGCRNVHPIATRSLTVREAARIQSFPDSYKFCGPLGCVRTGIGNAVPPLLSRSIALHLSATILDLVEVASF